ncbi:MAG: methylenetetrahydrofolate reductase [NAD(P)H] [Lachnospiraceae bacterium]|nr:methylenetetrahydrofolate reductase [NAD(P)H] [Lachnospiraceae bacterium]
MKIRDILNKNHVTISCELFPPKAGMEQQTTKTAVAELAKMCPDFMSVTYRAGGTSQKETIEIADAIQNGNHVTALVHLTCVQAKEQDVETMLAELKRRRIDNVLALRGDIPEGYDTARDAYHFAGELVRKIKTYGDFCVGGACYPEGHPEAAGLEADIWHVKKKVEAGCDFLTTQMFFDNEVLYRYLYRLRGAGVSVPVVAGIMPITSAAQVGRIGILSGGCVLPPSLKALIDAFRDRPNAMRQAGIHYATEQIIDLIANGVTHIHIYTMNKPDVAGRIFKNLEGIVDLREDDGWKSA